MSRVLYLWVFLFCVHCVNPVTFTTSSIPIEEFNSTAEKESFDLDLEEEDDEELSSCEDRNDCEVTEVFHIERRKVALDILFVVDVSQSMKKPLKKLGESMSSIFSYINDFDSQMAFTTADHGDHALKNHRVMTEQNWRSYKGQEPWFGRLMNLEYLGQSLDERILKNNDSFAEQIFFDTLTINPKDKACTIAPFCQGDHEQPLRALKAAIERPQNRSFFRKNADFISIIITNEDERSEDPKKATTAMEVKRAFESKFSRNKNFYGFGIIVKEDDQNCYRKQKRKTHTVRYGVRVSKLAHVTRGRNISICNENYGPALTGISQLIKQRVLDNVHLSDTPISSSIKVSLNPYQDVRWRLQGKKLVFSEPLEKDTEVSVTYHVY